MHFAIIGNGVAGITAALTLRERERSAKITLISGESDYFFSRTALMYAFMDRMTLRDLEPMERKAYDAQRIERIRGWVKDLDANSKTITLDSGKTIQYDALLLATGSRANQLAVPGAADVKQGMVNFVTLQDLEQCEKHTRIGGKAVVVGGGLFSSISPTRSGPPCYWQVWQALRWSLRAFMINSSAIRFRPSQPFV